MKNRRDNLRKRGLALFLVLAMCIGMLQITAFADEYEQNDDSGLDVQIVTVDHSNDTRDSDSNRSETSTEESDPAGEPSEDADAEESEPSESETNDGAVNTGDLEDYQTPETPSAPEAPAQPDQGSENDEFDLTQTDRKDQSEGVEVEIGPVTPETSANPSESDNQQTGASDENLPSQPEGDQKENSGTPDPSEPSAVTPEDKNWDVFYDKDSDTYQLTFNIKEDAVGDQTIDLTYALKLLNDYAETERESEAYQKTQTYNDVKKLLDTINRKGWTEEHTMQQVVDEVNYYIDCGYILGDKLDISQMPDGSEVYDKLRVNANVLEPGDIRKFEIFITSDSGHTYKYKDGSFVLATPDMTKVPDNEITGDLVEGFDGQNIPDRYLAAPIQTSVALRADSIIDLLIDAGILNDKSEKFHLNRLKPSEQTKLSSYLKEKYEMDDANAALEKYLLDYYGEKAGTTYTDLADLAAKNTEALTDLTNTATNWSLSLNGSNVKLDLDLRDMRYNKFYQSVLSFVYREGIKTEDFDPVGDITGNKKGQNEDGSWGYANTMWTYKEKLDYALVYYMAHKDAWSEANDMFNSMLAQGLTKEQATWAAFTMAINIDGELGDDGYQLTQWSWHNTIELEQMDGELKLTKADTDGNTITTDEAKFQLWRIDKKVTVNDDGTETEVPVKMYCTYDKETNSYTFTNVESVLETSGGKLDVLYTLLKDTVYYLQETEAPEGYEKDPRVYVIMDEELCGKTMQECIDENNQFLTPEEAANQAYAYLGSISDEKPLEIVFVNAKVQTPPTPPTPPTPEEPDTPDGDDDDDDDDTPSNPSEPTPEEPAYNVPEEPTPLAPAPEEEVFDEDVPLAEIPVEEEVEIPEEDVPLAEVPQTGDISAMWYVMSILSACGLASILALTGRKKEQED